MTITLRSVKGSALTHAELDGNFTDIQSQLDGKADAFSSIEITADTLLEVADHAGRDLRGNKATALTLTIQTDADGGSSDSEAFNAVQVGSGSVSFVAASGVTLLTPAGTAATTLAVGQFVGVVRIGPDTWTCVEKSGVASGGGGVGFGDSESFLLTPETIASTDFFKIGVYSSFNGSAVVRTSDNTSLYNSFRRQGVQAAATATDEKAGWNSGGNRALILGPRYHLVKMLFGAGDALVSNGTVGPKTFVGYCSDWVGNLVDGGTNPDGADSYARIGVMCKATDSQLKVVCSDGTNPPTVVALNGGAGFPANTNSADMYEVKIEYFPASTGSQRAEVTVTNKITGVVAPTVTLTSNLPVVGAKAALALGFIRSSGTVSGRPLIDIAGAAAGRFA